MNKFIATGKIVKKPEIAKIGDFGALLKASYDIEINNEENDNDIIPIICFGENAEFVKNNIQEGQIVGINGQIRFNKKSNNTLTIIAEKPEIINNIDIEDIKNNLTENVNPTQSSQNNKGNKRGNSNTNKKTNEITEEEKIEKELEAKAKKEEEARQENEQFQNEIKPINDQEHTNNENKNNEIDKTDNNENDKINNNVEIEKTTIEINNKFEEYFNKYNGNIYTINKDYNGDFSIKKWNIEIGNVLLNNDNGLKYIVNDNDIYLSNKTNRNIAIISKSILERYFEYYNGSSYIDINETSAKNIYEDLINNGNKSCVLKLKSTLEVSAYKIQIPEDKKYTLKIENANNNYNVKNNDFIICLNTKKGKNTNSQFALSEEVFNKIFIKKGA